MNQGVANGAATSHQSQQQPHPYRHQHSVESGQSQAPSGPPSAGLDHHPPQRHPQQLQQHPLGQGQANYAERMLEMPSAHGLSAFTLRFPANTTVQCNNSGSGVPVSGGGGGGNGAGGVGGGFAPTQAPQGPQFQAAFNHPPVYTQQFLSQGAPPYPSQPPFPFPDMNSQPPAVVRPGQSGYPPNAPQPSQSAQRSYPVPGYNQPVTHGHVGQHQPGIVPAQQTAAVGLPQQQLHQTQPAVQFAVLPQQQQQSAPAQPRKKKMIPIIDPETNEAINKEQLQEAAKDKDASDSAAAAGTTLMPTHAESAPMRGGPERGPEQRKEGISSTPLNEEEQKVADIRQNFALQITNKCLGKNTPDSSEQKGENEVPNARTVPPPSSVPPTDGSSMEKGPDVQRQTCSVPPPERTVTPSSVQLPPAAVVDESLAAALKEKLAMPPPSHVLHQQAQFAPPGTTTYQPQQHQPPPSLIATGTGYVPTSHPGNGSVPAPLMGGGQQQPRLPTVCVGGGSFQQPMGLPMQFAQPARLPPHAHMSYLGPSAPLEECINGPDMSEELENGVDTGRLTKEEKIRRLDEEFTSYMQDADEKSNIDNKVYSVGFLLLMRKIVKELQHVKCPKTEAELAEMGIDLAGMPASVIPNPSRVPRGRFEPGKDTFVPPWQTTMSQQTRPPGGAGTRPYIGRHSDGTKGRGKKIPPNNRQSMQGTGMPRNELLPKKSETAWKPKREEKLSDRTEDDARYENIKKELRGLLNKITPTTYEDLSTRFCAYKVHEDPKLLTRVIDLIFDKAVEEERFCPLYSNLCKKQVEMENAANAATSASSGEQKKGGTFRLAIIERCQKTFEGDKSPEMKELQKELEKAEEEKDDAKKAQLQERLDLLKKKEKRRFLGIITFIAQLYRHDLLIDKIIEWCVVELVKLYSEQNVNDEIYIEYAVKMLETVGQIYDNRKRKVQMPSESLAPPASENSGGDRKKAPVAGRKSQQKGAASPANASSPAPEQQQDPIDKVLVHLASIKAKLSNRCRFMIMDLEDMRKNNWQPKRKKQGPKVNILYIQRHYNVWTPVAIRSVLFKTMEQVRNDLQEEAAENQAERDAYEKKTAAARADYVGRKSSRQNTNLYQGRGSTDNRTQMQQNPPFDKRAAAAQASTQATTLTQKKEFVSSLKMTDQSAKLGKGGQSFFSSRKSEHSLAPGTMYADRVAAPSPPSVIASAPTPPPTQQSLSSSAMEQAEESRNSESPSTRLTLHTATSEEGAVRD